MGLEEESRGENGEAFSIWESVYQYYQQVYMKTEADDANYEVMISKLAKGSIDDKAQSLKKLLFLYENARSRIYLYERRITECLELSLLIEEKDICLNALSLLEKMIINTSSESEIMAIIKKRLLSKMVLNLGSIEVTIRKVSHKCILQFLRKFKDIDTVIAIYLKTAIQQNENNHLKLKAINSLHSLFMAEVKQFHHNLDSAKTLLEELIHASFQKEYVEVRRAALICLIFIIRVKGAQNNLRTLSSQAESELYQLKYESEQLCLLLESIFKMVSGDSELEGEEIDNNTPSPKFISIQESMELKPSKPQSIDQILDKIPEAQLKIFNQVSYAEQFLKKLEKTCNWQINEIEQFAPFLEKCLVDDSIKLFSISKKIVEVIFNSEDGKKKQYYVVLVPCIVSGIGNKRFIVRKNLDKLVRQYIKNHTQVWVQNFVERFATSKNQKIKEMLIDLVTHAYRTSPEFYYPTERTFQVFNVEIGDNTSTLKRKVIDCILLIIERQGKDEKTREQMLRKFSADPYNKIIRKIGKANNSVGSLSQEGEQLTLEASSPVALKKQRKQRLVTAEPEKLNFLDKSAERKKTDNVSEEKYQVRPLVQYSRERKVRNSHIEISFKMSKKPERRSKDDKEKEKTSIERLPELKKGKNSSISKNESNESPVKRSLGQRNIVYVDRQNLKPLQNPRSDLEVALVDIKDSNWSIQFDGISKIRSVVEYHKQLLTQQIIPLIVNELLQNLSNLRSGVTKLALMCLNEIMRRLHKRMYPFSENIILTIIKKSITTSDFMQDEIKRCITTAIEELCLPKIISALNSIKESRSVDIRMTFMLCVESMIRTERIYRKQFEWIWNILVYFNEEPQFNLRSECKRLTKLILELYKDWKTDLTQMRKDCLQKIDKLLKSIAMKGQNNLWIEIENYQFEKVVLNKAITQKYFAANYSKFEELDRNYTVKKNWKDRIRLINELFQNAYDHPNEFENSLNVRKYFQIAIEHIDDKNPGLLINAINNLIRSLDFFSNILEEFLGSILQKVVPVLQTRRGEIIGITSKLLNKMYTIYNPNKIAKQYLRMLVGNYKGKNEVISQLLVLLRDHEKGELENRSIREIPFQKNSLTNSQATINANCQNVFLKSLSKLCSQKPVEINGNWNNRIKELIMACQRRFGQEFANKLMANNPKVLQIMP